MKQNKKTNFTRHFFIDLAKECGLNATIFEQLGSRRDTEIVVDNDTLEMLVKLQEQFARLEKMGDDEYRGFYIELPRPTPEEWGDCEASIVDGEYESKQEYLRDWKLLNPRETVWYHVSSARYRENRTIQFTDRKHSYFTIANYSRYINRVGNNFPNEWQRDFLAKLALYFHKLIDAIIQDPKGFNDYVANHLPYQQRDGKIARKEFNRIEPRFKIEVEDETTAIKALEDSVCKNFGRPLDTMTIRSYCKYYPIGSLMKPMTGILKSLILHKRSVPFRMEYHWNYRMSHITTWLSSAICRINTISTVKRISTNSHRTIMGSWDCRG